MSIGLIALLDDVAAIAKAAAASVDDVAAQAAKAGVKAAGVVIDDAAVTPRYVTGFSPAREVPIVWKIAVGSVRNKLVFLLPIALILSLAAPWAITPLLMIGGAYLAYEGTEKIYHALLPHRGAAHEAKIGPVALDAQALEDAKVASAIKTDFILSAEIMAITLAAVPAESSIWAKIVILAVVGVGITAAVYGGVALIVKADDAGLALASNQSIGSAGRAFGRGLIAFMPWFLSALAVVGTAAMIWVGGGIIVHGLEEFGVAEPGHLIEQLSALAGEALPALAGLTEWLVFAVGAGLFGLVVGAAMIPLASFVIAPLWSLISRSGGDAKPTASN